MSSEARSRRVLLWTALAWILSLAWGVAWAQTGGVTVADPKTGCRIWWPSSARPEAPDLGGMDDEKTRITVLSARWSGECRNGLAEGAGTFAVTERHERTVISATVIWTGEGTFSAGRLKGRAFFTSNEFERREGEFVDGVLNGRGVINWDVVGSARWAGSFRNGLLNGWGTLDEEAHSDDGEYYWHLEGEWQDGLMHGKGVKTAGKRGCPAELRYEGEWQHGVMDGRATIKTLDGQTLTGNFHEGRFGERIYLLFFDTIQDLRKVCR